MTTPFDHKTQEMKDWISTSTQFLIRHEPTGTFYLRKRIGGKIVRQALGTKSITVAKAKLPGAVSLLTAQRGASKSSGSCSTIGECIDAVKARVAINPNLRAASSKYRTDTIIFLEKTFPGLRKLKPKEFTSTVCLEWFSSIKGQYSGALVNNALGSLRMIVKEAMKSGLILKDPTEDIKRTRVVPKKLTLPSPDDFKKMVACIRKPKNEIKHSWRSDAAADLVEFLAYSGCRKAEANKLKWSDIDERQKTIFVTGKGGKSRYIPIVSKMAELLQRLPRKSDFVLRVLDAEKSMTRAAEEAGVPRITHHDLRHLFATVCIESGVDIPTVSRWLGHVDGGALALRVYGHLRKDHSASAADKVMF